MRLFSIIMFFFLTSGIHAALPVIRTQMQMGTLVSISLPQTNKASIQEGFNLIHDIEMALSSYAPDAEVYRLNHGASVQVSDYTKEAIILSRRYYRESHGYFDITVGSITKHAYRFGEDEKMPEAPELDAAVLGMDGIVLKEGHVWLRPGITIDLGGMGKGYAVDKVAEHYRKSGIKEAVIAASGDIRCLGVCRIEIEHPFEAGIIGSFTTKHTDTAISTSGNYRRYVKNRANNHLIDPKRKRSQQQFASITLVARLPNSDLDAYATAAGVMPFEEAIGFLNERNIEYILITTDKRVILSEGLGEATEAFQLKPL